MAETAHTWYADYEWNLTLWGCCALTATESDRVGAVESLFRTGTEGRYDRYIGSDHAWGGGLEAKYFFRRYFGIGLNAYVLSATRTAVEVDSERFSFRGTAMKETRAIGSALGTLTLRYPIRESRYAPYAYFGGGGITGGGENDELVRTFFPNRSSGRLPFVRTEHHGGRTEAIGQFGAGLEIRITPHVGLLADFSWNVINRQDNNFEIARSGINFAF